MRSEPNKHSYLEVVESSGASCALLREGRNGSGVDLKGKVAPMSSLDGWGSRDGEVVRAAEIKRESSCSCSFEKTSLSEPVGRSFVLFCFFDNGFSRLRSK